jgi:hypothetical protein
MGKMKETLLDSYDRGYNNGYYDAVAEMSWQCGDCGNRYDRSVMNCPNKFLDKAILKVDKQESHDE